MEKYRDAGIDPCRGLYIAADKSLFTGLDHLDKKGFGFFRKAVKREVQPLDPVVFHFVNGGALVISKWGAEAESLEVLDRR
jgi:hypothetical protein